MWETARRSKPGFRAANLCWWYAMGATTDLTVTPRPIYHADGRKSPGLRTRYPPQLHDNLTGPLGEFPLFQYWGPTASIKSPSGSPTRPRSCSTTSSSTCCWSTSRTSTTTTSASAPRARRRFRPPASSTRSLGDLIDHARGRGDQVVVLSEYGITPAQRPVEINRALRRAGLLNVYTQAGMEYLDPWTSRAFAVADHQIAHVYVRTRPTSRPRARRSPRSRAWARCSRARRWRHGLAHERSGELVVLAERDAWFTYHYWLDNAHAPDFGRQVEIHRKPGYDPAELFMDPDDEKGAKLRAGLALARKTTGFRYVMSVVGLDASKHVKGTHGLLPPGDEDGPVFLCSEESHARERVAATDVRDLILDLSGVREAART